MKSHSSKGAYDPGGAGAPLWGAVKTGLRGLVAACLCLAVLAGAPSASAAPPEEVAGTDGPDALAPKVTDDDRATLVNTAMLGWSAVALAGGPASIYLIADDLSIGDAVALAFATSGGVFCLVGGAVLVGVGVMAVAFAPLFALLGSDAAGALVIMGLVLGAAGTGLVLASPFVFGWGSVVAQSKYGTRPDNLITLSIVTMLGGGLGAVLSTAVLAQFYKDSNGLVVVAVIATTTLLFANLTYATFRSVDEGSGAPAMITLVTPPIAF